MPRREKTTVGAQESLDQLLPLVYDELRAVAARALAGERSGQTLHPTALVHEVYLRLAAQRQRSIRDRRQFFALTARIVRRVLVDHARQRNRQKRGAQRDAVPLQDHLAIQAGPSLDTLALHEALERLATVDEALCRLVELRFFAGFTLQECAAALQKTTSKVFRDWEVARSWLKRELEGRS